MDTAIGSVGKNQLIRSYRLSLLADGLKPHTISCYIRDAERFLAHVGKPDPKEITSDDAHEYFGWM
ncbi:MAG: phage integrase N-terminal SAM-like domain-containing protein, partial [Chloroflexi bacterium]|nr:phage integrase N-terminal SAM-like domain-containing protein [Chloroflexota bacterium]